MTHGFTSNGKYPPIYNVWRNMKARCTNKNSILYKYYGGRGIKVSNKWNNFLSFYFDMGEPPKGFELDRINVNKGYYKNNCRWVDKKTQQRNQRRTVFLTFNGITRKRIEWSELLGINSDTIRRRLDRGHSIERAFSKINHRNGKKL